MSTFLDVLRGRMQQRRINSAEVLAAAARDAAADKSIDVGAVEAALVQTGTTMADFEATVEKAKRRAEWRAEAEKLAVTSGKVSKLEARVTTEVEKKIELVRAANERIEAAEQELATARRARDRAAAARDKLTQLDNLPSPVAEQYRQAIEAKEQAEAEVARINRELREVREKVAFEQRWIEQIKAGKQDRQSFPKASLPEWASDGFGGELTKHENSLKRAKRREAELLKELPAAERELAKAESGLEKMLPAVLAA